MQRPAELELDTSKTACKNVSIQVEHAEDKHVQQHAAEPNNWPGQERQQHKQHPQFQTHNTITHPNLLTGTFQREKKQELQDSAAVYTQVISNCISDEPACQKSSALRPTDTQHANNIFANATKSKLTAAAG